jgi:CDP-diacylglycerol--glycerol-3-phosphate 3-phosphatidyltransferase
MGRVHAWMVVLIVGREFAVSGLRNLAISEGYTISASDLGKTKMVMQVVAVSLLMLAPGNWLLEQLAYIALWLVVLFATVSMIDYFRAFWSKVDGGRPVPKPAPPELLVLRKERKQDLAT